MKNLIKKYNLNIDHFLKPSELFSLNQFNSRLKNYKGLDQLQSNTRIRHSTLKRFLIQNGVEYKCKVCGLKEWLNLTLTLDVDHLDENFMNNKLDNLQFLCPNCHRQKSKINWR